MVKKLGDYRIPWSPDGSLLHFPTDGRRVLRYEDNQGHVLLPEEWDILTTDERRALLNEGMKSVLSGPDWRPNEPFHATLQLRDMASGRSAKYVIWGAVGDPLDRRTYPMFVVDLLDVARAGIQVGGIVSGRWAVRKRGENYGLVIAP